MDKKILYMSRATANELAVYLYGGPLVVTENFYLVDKSAKNLEDLEVLYDDFMDLGAIRLEDTA